jgi:hypothetical protein
MNKAGGRVKALATIKLKWFRQIPKNWQPRCAKTSASERRRAVGRTARRSLPSALTKKATSLPSKMHRKFLTKVLPDNDTHVERVVRPDVLRRYPR